MATVYVGLDVGSSSCHVVAVDGEGTVVQDRKFATGQANLIATMESLKGEVTVHLEASALAGWICRVLRTRGYRVVVSHPKSNAWIAKDPLKCDRVDAYKLAELLRMGRVHEVYYPDEAHRAVFKQLVQHYDDVTDEQARLKVKIKARLKAQGVLIRGQAVYTEEGRQKALAQVEHPAAREAIEQLYELMDQARQTRRQARRLLGRESRRYPEIALFDGVPGVALVSACRFSAYVQTPHRFRTKRKLWRYCRLGITDRSSDGKPLGRKRLDHNGNGRLKQMSRTVFLGAMKARGDNAFKRAHRSTLSRTQDKTHARLSTQRKILTVLLAMWKGGARYQDDKG